MKCLLNTLKHRVFLAVLSSVASCFLLTGCQSGNMRLYGDRVPAGSLRLAWVMGVGSRKEILESSWGREILTGTAIKETEIRDGSGVMTAIYCCGGPNEKGEARVVYVPAGITVERNDIVEVRVGHPPEGDKLGTPNTVTRIRQRAGEVGGSCRWDPPDERLWVRILYADWMPAEGWVRQGGLFPAWYKPPTAGKP